MGLPARRRTRNGGQAIVIGGKARVIDAVDYAAGDQPVESCYLRPIVNQKVRCDEDNVADVAGTRGDVAWQNVAPDMVEQVMVRGDVQLESIRKLRLDNQVDDIASAFGMKSKPSPDNIFNSSFLPTTAQRRYR